MSGALDDRQLLRRFAAEQGPWVHALFDVEAGIAESLRAELAHEVSHARLAWWSDELDRLACGEPRHPATCTLLHEARLRGQSAVDLRPVLEVARRDLAAVAYLGEAELDAHWQDWGRSVFRTVCLLALPRERLALAERTAALAGPAIHAIERLLEFPIHARAGRLYVALGDPPADERPWLRAPLAARERDELAQRLDNSARRLRETLAWLRTQLRADERPAAAPLVLWLTLSEDAAHAVAGADPQTPSRWTPLRRTLKAWRIAVALRRGRWPTHGA